jgi:hypothetical protein
MIRPSGGQPPAGLAVALGLVALQAYFVCFSYYQLMLFLNMVSLTVAPTSVFCFPHRQPLPLKSQIQVDDLSLLAFERSLKVGYQVALRTKEQDGWIHGCTNERMHERTNEGTNERKNNNLTIGKSRPDQAAAPSPSTGQGWAAHSAN